MEGLERILIESEQLFAKYGIKSVSMDDVAKHLGISKKTLYQFVKDKNELVHLAVENHLTHMENSCCSLAETKENAIEQIFSIAKFVVTNMKEVSTALIYDLKKYHQESYKLIEKHKENTICRIMKLNMMTGMQQGYYRESFDPEIICRLYMIMAEGILSFEYFPSDSYSFVDKYKELLVYHLHGICTPKGIEYLKENQHIIAKLNER